MSAVARAEILGLIPHQGGMCLLDAVEAWGEAEITCSTGTHRDPANPLRAGGALAAVHLAEYGAQAMAIHGGLVGRAAGEPVRPGLLVTLRDFKVHVARIDDVDGALTVRAKRLVANPDGKLYAFEVDGGGELLACGRGGVIHRD